VFLKAKSLEVRNITFAVNPAFYPQGIVANNGPFRVQGGMRKLKV